MTDAQLQRKLNQLAALANELDAEAKERYGTQGFLFYEATGHFHIMAGDTNGTAGPERLDFIRASSTKLCNMGAGAW